MEINIMQTSHYYHFPLLIIKNQENSIIMYMLQSVVISLVVDSRDRTDYSINTDNFISY